VLFDSVLVVSFNKLLFESSHVFHDPFDCLLLAYLHRIHDLFIGTGPSSVVGRTLGASSVRCDAM